MPTPVPTTLRSAQVASIAAAVDEAVSPCKSLSDAAQIFAGVIYDMFATELALVRTYALVTESSLTASHRRFLDARGLTAGLTPETPILALVGTRGARQGWNRPADSQNHLCIPFTSLSAVEAVPMMAALLTQLGLELDWLHVKRAVFARKLVGGFNGLFYVADAARTADHLGRLIIPAQDFVAANRVVTVFGNGGAYLDGTIVASIFFSREALNRTDAERFAPLASTFKKRTSRLVADGRIFST